VDVAILGAHVNLADASVYPASVAIHDKAVDLIATLWKCPNPPPVEDPSVDIPHHYSGSGTVGSTEACLLAGLALKFRWRKWYGGRHQLSDIEVLGVRPNIVISSCYQAAWEKFFRYFDVEPRFVKPSIKTFTVEPSDMMELCDERTIAIVAILGNHYNGAYDPVWDIDAQVTKLNASKGFQIGIHIDAASGGFIAPFQDDMPKFDFRLDNVLSISASGHKFGESICGTGWVVFRQREDLTEHIAISVSYLGVHCDSITLNFSRPASGCFVQMYKFVSSDDTRRFITRTLLAYAHAFGI
jgi:glutamate decarboxylase